MSISLLYIHPDTFAHMHAYTHMYTSNGVARMDYGAKS